MSIRSFLRGDSSVDVDAVGRAMARRYDLEEVDIEPLEGDNWLSVPLVVNDSYFVKVVSPQNTATHSVFTALRNLGARMWGSGPLFESFTSPGEMAEHEMAAARRMRRAGVPAPEPLDVVELDDVALLVFEYIDDFEPLSQVDLTDELVDLVFENLHRLHDSDLAHGDLSLENVLVVDGSIYFIDATRLSPGERDDAVAYDLACALGALSSRRDADDVVEAARRHYSDDELVSARDYLVVVRLRPGIEDGFSLRELRTAIQDAVKK
ncbi:MAG: RIO1 family regulatory kinase/ATPase [Halobacteriota archaeon]